MPEDTRDWDTEVTRVLLLYEIEEYRRRYEANEFDGEHGRFESWLESQPNFAAYWRWRQSLPREAVTKAEWEGDRYLLNWYFSDLADAMAAVENKADQEPEFSIDYCDPGTLNMENHPHLSPNGLGYELSAIARFHPDTKIPVLRFYVVRKTSGLGWFGPKKAEYFVSAGTLLIDTSHPDMYSAHEAAQRLAVNTGFNLLTDEKVSAKYGQALGQDTSNATYTIKYLDFQTDKPLDARPRAMAIIESRSDAFSPVSLVVHRRSDRGGQGYLLRAVGWVPQVDILRECQSEREAMGYGLMKAYDLAHAIKAHSTVEQWLGSIFIDDPRYPATMREIVANTLREIAQ